VSSSIFDLTGKVIVVTGALADAQVMERTAA
jgi:hypothetical protein